MPFPTTDDQNKDYEQAAMQMFDQEPTRRNPVYVNYQDRTLMIVDRNEGDVVIAETVPVIDPETWTAPIETLWNDWVNGGLSFQSRAFLNTEEDTYNAESELPVRRQTAAELADSVAQLSGPNPTPDQRQALSEIYSQLDYEPTSEPSPETDTHTQL